MKMTEAQKVSKSAPTGWTLPQAHTTASAPASTNDSTYTTLPCRPNTPDSSPARA